MNENGMNQNNMYENNTYENNMGGDYMQRDSSGDAVARLQEKRNEVAKAMKFVFIGVPCLMIPPLGIALILIGATKVSKAQKELKGLYKDAFVREPLARNFQNVIYEPGNGYSKEAVQDFQLCEMGNRLYSEDYIRATYAGVNFEVAEVKVMYVDNSDKSNYSSTYFEGRMLLFYFPDKLVSSVLVYSRKFKHRAISHKEVKHDQVELEGTRFNKEFDVYSPVPHDVFYLLTPQVMERLQALADRYESIAMRVVGNIVMLAFNQPGVDAFDSKVSIGNVDVDAEMAKVQVEIDDIKAFISLILNQNQNR